MFYAGGGKSTYSTSSPYDALGGRGGQPRSSSGGPPGSGPPPRFPTLEELDIYPVPGFKQRTDVGNGSAPVSGSWHIKAEPLPKDPSEPFYVAKDLSAKFLNSENGYTIISILNRLPHSAPYNFTLSHLTFSKPKDIAAVPWRSNPVHSAFRPQDGALSLQVDGYGEAVQVLPGDVASIPRDTKYKVHAIVPGTKTLYVSAGGNGLDSELLKAAKPWESPTWPVNFV
jgi:hypothetical protein